MKKLMTAILMLACSNLALALDKVHFAIGDWAPYTSQLDANGKIAEQIVVEALELEGVTVELSYNSWSDSYDQVKAGQADGTFPWYLNEERYMDFLFSDPLLEDKQVFFHLKSTDFNWAGFDDLKNYRIGGTEAYSHVSELKKHGIDAIVSADEADSFKKVLNGDVDAYPASEIVGKQALATLFSAQDAQKFTTHAIPMTVDNMFLLVSKNIENSEAIIQALNSGLQQLKASGRYQEILDQI